MLALTALLAVWAATSSGATSLAPFDSGKAAFTLRVRGELCPYRIFGVYVLPAEVLDLEVVEGAVDSTFQLVGPDDRPFDGLARRWTWTAPEEPGLYPLEVRQAGSDQAIRLRVFVMVPARQARDGLLNGYRIGSYPATPLRGLTIYRPPRGFVEVTAQNADTPIAPHFTLGQFLCKQEGGYPKYVVLRERLLLKLEHLLQRVNEKGLRADTFFIMSGYRTPAYNAAIGNVKFSRHQWGGAADIFLDVDPEDGVMDDLNRDGRIDGRDADLLYDLIDRLGFVEGYGPYIGGLGKYGSTSNHGPFVHVDARGFRARWGR